MCCFIGVASYANFHTLLLTTRLHHRCTLTMMNADPYDILGVARDASKGDMQHAFRKRARALHPDTSDDPESVHRFRELVSAFEHLQQKKPGSCESHKLWPYLTSLDKYWSREQGHDTAEELEDYLRDLGKFDEYLEELRADESLAAASDSMSAAEEAATEAATDPADVITALLGYRVFLGSEQWHVRWSGMSGDDAEERTTWERWEALERLGCSELQLEAAEILREEAT